MSRTQNNRFQRWAHKWLFRQQKAETGEAFLSQRRVFIIPSKAGIAYFLMLIVLFIGSINYNLSLGFAFTFLLGACAVIDMHLTFRNLAHLYLTAGRSQPVFAGEDAQFEFHLINRSKHDRYAIWVNFVAAGLSDLAQPVDIAAQTTRNVLLTVPAARRGWLATPRVRLYTRFPLGLLRAWSYWQSDARTLVYPHPEDEAAPLPMTGTGKQDGQGSAGTDDFAGIRAYQAGDSLKRLAWRHIARMDAESADDLVTKHFEGGAANEVFLDFAALPRNMDLEAKLSRMTRWVIEAEARGLPYAFSLDGTVFAAALGPVHREACLRALALYRNT